MLKCSTQVQLVKTTSSLCSTAKTIPGGLEPTGTQDQGQPDRLTTDPVSEGWSSRTGTIRAWNTEESAFYPTGKKTQWSGNRPPALGSCYSHQFTECALYRLTVRVVPGTAPSTGATNRSENGHGSYSRGADSLEGEMGILSDEYEIPSSEVKERVPWENTTVVTPQKAGPTPVCWEYTTCQACFYELIWFFQLDKITHYHHPFVCGWGAMLLFIIWWSNEAHHFSVEVMESQNI